MKIYISLIVLLLLIEKINTNNLLNNPDFSKDILNPNEIRYLSSLEGWTFNSTIQLLQCNYISTGSNCTGNYLDMNSVSTYTTITQTVFLQKNANLNFTLEYCVPRSNNPINKTLEVYFNSVEIHSITTIQTDWTCSNKVLFFK